VELLYHPLIVALFTILWETILRNPVLKLVLFFNRKRIGRDIFRFHGDLYIAKSFVWDSLSKASRESDNIIQGCIEEIRAERVEVLDQDPRTSIEDLNHNLIVIGSPKYNKHAELIQRHYASKFEFVWDLYEGEPSSKVLKIINEYGDEYASSSDFKSKRTHADIDYGVLFHARLRNDKRIVWMGGIHAPGTLGVFKYLRNNPEILVKDAPNSREFASSWFFRVKYDKRIKESLDMVQEVELIDLAPRCQVRSVEAKPKALICDLGNVVMLFDRNRTYRAIGHWLGMPFKEVQSDIEGAKIGNDKITDLYERGDLDDSQFYSAISKVLKGSGSRKLSFPLFSEFWSDIFWPNLKMIEALKSVKNELTLVLLSNTNNLHFEDVKKHYRDYVELFDDRIVLSYKERMTKSNPDIFAIARRTAGSSVTPAECIYVDDKSEFVNQANSLGMKGILYFSHPQFVYSMRELGVYVP